MSEFREVLSVKLDAAQDQWGYPRCCGCSCCPGEQPHFVRPEFYPAEVTELVGVDRLEKFFSDVAEVMQETGVPTLPLALCIPSCCLLLAFMAVYSRRRKRRIESLLEEFNKSHRDQGVYLEWNAGYTTDSEHVALHPAISLMVNTPAREAYLAKKRDPGASAPPAYEGAMESQPFLEPKQ